MIYYNNNSTFESLFYNNPEEKEIYNLFEKENEPYQKKKKQEISLIQI